MILWGNCFFRTLSSTSIINIESNLSAGCYTILLDLDKQKIIKKIIVC